MGDPARVDIKKREMSSRTPGVVVLSQKEMMMAAVALAKVNPRASAPAGGPISKGKSVTTGVICCQSPLLLV
jgi:hypothetical protein